MDITPAPERTAEEITSIVASSLQMFSDPALKAAIEAFLVVPRMEVRYWDWSKEPIPFPTWVIAESNRYDYGIVYCERGFGPKCPWGLVFSSADNIGADYCWYPSLQEAFSESRLIEEHHENCSDV